MEEEHERKFRMRRSFRKAGREVWLLECNFCLVVRV
jgi:hypothetical protein